MTCRPLRACLALSSGTIFGGMIHYLDKARAAARAKDAPTTAPRAKTATGIMIDHDMVRVPVP